jgi:leucine dehydrogenase
MVLVQERPRAAREVRAAPASMRADDITDQARLHDGFDNHERVLRWRDPATGLGAIVAVHDRALGPAVAACRMAAHRSLGQATVDALRRSAAATARSALVGLPLGGAAVTIIGNPRTGRSPAMFRALGRLTDRLSGGVLLLPDAGLGSHDLDFAAMETPFVLGASPGGSGDSAVATAYGAYVALGAAIQRRTGAVDARGLSIAIQGVGRVGYALCALLARDGAHLLVADTDGEAAGRAAHDFGAAIVVPSALPRVRADALVVCGGTAVIDPANAAEVGAGIVVATQEGTFADPTVPTALAERGVLVVPDILAGAGALLNAAGELDRGGYDHGRAMARIRAIGGTLRDVLDCAAREDEEPQRMADLLALRTLARRRRPLRLAAMTPAWAHA